LDYLGDSSLGAAALTSALGASAGLAASTLGASAGLAASTFGASAGLAAAGRFLTGSGPGPLGGVGAEDDEAAGFAASPPHPTTARATTKP